MGNASSITGQVNNSKLATEIDRIASNYILSQNFNDMNKLSEKEHCDKMVVLTAKIINDNLNPLEQKEMVDRINNENKDNERKYKPDEAEPKDTMLEEENNENINKKGGDDNKPTTKRR